MQVARHRRPVDPVERDHRGTQEAHQQPGARPDEGTQTRNRSQCVGSPLSEKKIAQPSAFIAGGEDDVLKYNPETPWHDLMRDWLADLRFLEIIPGVGHWIQLEAPERTTQEILRFLNEVR